MANEEQLAILRQGVEVWNEWREKNPEAKIDLREANLIEASLSRAFLREADLREAHLWRADLREAKLTGAELSGADLRFANLDAAQLIEVKLWGAFLRGATLREANLWRADLRKARLIDADLREANLREADLREAYLSGSRWSNATLGGTTFEDSDLSQAVGLEEVVHEGPSLISREVFLRSKGNVPRVFLRGCGLSDWETEVAKLYNPDLSNHEINDIQYRMYDLRATQALQISPLFVSYSHGDSEFVDKIGDSLTRKGIRYWRDIHEMKAGRIEKQIDRAIRHNSTVLLILSKHSVKSDWVEHEVRTARQLEKDMGHDVLCPVALDDSWRSSRWPKRVMEQIMEYNILDFSSWKDDSKFEGMFRKLIDGLELFYKG